MKKGFTLLLLLACFGIYVVKSQELPAITLPNVQYGTDSSEQVMDVFLPAGRDTSVTKVVVLIHGGGWAGGNRNDMNAIKDWVFQAFPQYAVVNLEYRLGTVEDPGFPKQIDDIKLVLDFLKQNSEEYQIQNTYALVGYSAGAHLSMLYGYMVDQSKEVKVIWNIVGPTDFTDPTYEQFPDTQQLMLNFVGNTTLEDNRAIYEEASPVYAITANVPSTISFYGTLDLLVPTSQATILRNKLNAVGVSNEYYIYLDEGHGFSNPENIMHMYQSTYNFFQTYF